MHLRNFGGFGWLNSLDGRFHDYVLCPYQIRRHPQGNPRRGEGEEMTIDSHVYVESSHPNHCLFCGREPEAHTTKSIYPEVEMGEQEKRCGTCKWFRWADIPADREAGGCSTPIPYWMDLQAPRWVYRNRVIDCPCWQSKEPSYDNR